MAGSISGTVTDADSHAAIAGIQVCHYESKGAIEEACTETGSDGKYSLGGLPAGSYSISFYGDRYNLNYVTQRWNGKVEGPGDPVVLGANEDRTGIDAAMEEGGSIAGTVTDAVSADPVAGLQVCAFASTALGGSSRCTRTNGNGQYTLNGLRELPNYQVEFLGEAPFNYITQYFEGSEDFQVWDPVAVGAPGTTTTGIDAALNPGVEISGVVTEAGTHKPLADIEVSLLEPGSEEFLTYVFTGPDGHYAFLGLPAGTYVVAFSRPRFPFDGDGFSTQFYKGATSFAAATPLTVTPPEVRTGIDGEVVNEFPYVEPPPIQETIYPPPPPKKPPLRCKKGFRKKKVKGKARCVKIHKRKRHKGGSRRAAAPR